MILLIDFLHYRYAILQKNLYSLNEFINQALNEIAAKQYNAVNDFFSAHKKWN